MSAIHFGVMLPQHGTSWSEAREAAYAAEEAGSSSASGTASPRPTLPSSAAR